MQRVKIIKNCCVYYGGESFTPASGVFEMDDETAADRCKAGTVEVLVDMDTGEEVPSAEEIIPDAEESPPQETPFSPVLSLSSLESMTPSVESILDAKGITVAGLAVASLSSLKALRGIGTTKAKRLKAEARALVSEE